MPYLTVIPAQRTVPGVEEFDYAADPGHGLQPGDVLAVPFRKSLLPALVIRVSETSPVADKARRLEDPTTLLRLGPDAVRLLEDLSAYTFSSKPTVFSAWIRYVPKRQRRKPGRATIPDQLELRPAVREVFSVPDPSSRALELARSSGGKTLILVARKTSAESAARDLACPFLHSDLPPTAAWDAVSGFVSGAVRTLVATKLGAWLTLHADRIILAEPEDDDFKQDELTPRYDARWIVDWIAARRPEVSIHSFCLTPRLGSSVPACSLAPDLKPEPFSSRGRHQSEILTDATLATAQQAVDEGKPLLVIHPVHGERARQVCRDCGWRAVCPSCGYGLSPESTRYAVRGTPSGLCRHCGKRSPLPAACPNCGGTDFSRSRAGRDRLALELKSAGLSAARILDLSSSLAAEFPHHGLVIVSDLSLLAGAMEDIRRRERLVMNWRRIAAKAETSACRLVVQGRDQVLEACAGWLSASGLAEEWTRELAERRAFGFPPTVPLAKLLVNGDESAGLSLLRRLEETLPHGWDLQGPFPVAFRPSSSGPRQVIHLRPSPGTTGSDLIQALNPFRNDAIIDLDPVAFFS